MPIVQQIHTRILIVEDNKIDARLTRHALQQIAGWPCTVEIVDDGEKAIKFLRREGPFSTVEKPDLVILDLNLPKCDGTEVLQSIRSNEDLAAMRVFIFSSSPVGVAEERMENAQVKADCYFEKPNHIGTYASICAEIRNNYLRLSGVAVSANA